MASINREQAAALIAEQLVPEVMQDVPKQSVVLQLGRRLPDMTSDKTRIPVLDVLPTAYWMDAENALTKTTRQAWEGVYMNAADLQVIVPISRDALEDSSYDMIGEISPRLTEATAAKIDLAVLFGVGKPAAWPNDLITAARQAGNNVACSGGTITYDLLMASGGLLSKVEEAGYVVNGVVASIKTKSKLRGIKDSDGSPIFLHDMQSATPYALDGAPIFFPTDGGIDDSVAQMIAGDFSQLVYSIRKDVEVKVLDQASIFDPSTKTLLYALAQQNMIALMLTFRMGWALPNPATRVNGDRTNVPFAYLEPATAVTTQTLTFTVKDGTGTSAGVVEGAVVNVNGSRIKTNSSGQAVFNLRAGNYDYKVTADGYKVYSGSSTIASTAVTAAVALTAKS